MNKYFKLRSCDSLLGAMRSRTVYKEKNNKMPMMQKQVATFWKLKNFGQDPTEQKSLNCVMQDVGGTTTTTGQDCLRWCRENKQHSGWKDKTRAPDWAAEIPGTGSSWKKYMKKLHMKKKWFCKYNHRDPCSRANPDLIGCEIFFNQQRLPNTGNSFEEGKIINQFNWWRRGIKIRAPAQHWSQNPFRTALHE